MSDSASPEILSCWLEPEGEEITLKALWPLISRRTTKTVPGLTYLIGSIEDFSPDGAMEVWSNLSMIEGEDQEEISYCWLWLAASFGSPDAAGVLARTILEKADELVDRMPPEQVAKLAGFWLKKADSKSRRGFEPLGGDVPRRLRRTPNFATPETADDDEDPSSVSRASLEKSGDGVGNRVIGGLKSLRKGVVVVDHIGDASSREGKEISKRYERIIGHRLPFKGQIVDPMEVKREFLETFPWAENVARYISGQFALLRGSGNENPKLPPLLLVGPSGCGKTTMLEWITKKCGFPSTTIAVGGTHDAAGLPAVTRGWQTTRASAPVQLMMESGCCNPAIILDEVDKGSNERNAMNGSVQGAALAMLQPPSGSYTDGCLMAPVNLSHVTFMASANDLTALSEPLRKRFIVLKINSPSPEHFDHLLPGVIANEARRLGIDPVMMPWHSDSEEEWLRQTFISEGCSIRTLETAYRLLSGELAAEEAQMMQRPN